jgi:hypothetical protein
MAAHDQPALIYEPSAFSKKAGLTPRVTCVVVVNSVKLGGLRKGRE